MKARVMLAACLATVLGPVLGAPCPTKVPAGLAAVSVGDDVAVNGLKLAIMQVQGKEHVDTILDRSEAEWKGAGHDVRRSTTAGWQVLSALGKGCLVTLQLIDKDGAFGYLSHSKKGAVALTADDMGLPLPGDARIASSVASDDDGRRGIVMSLSSQQSMDNLATFFMEQLQRKNWSGIRSHRVRDKKRGVEMTFLSAQRNRRQVEIVIWPEMGSQVVLTVADAL